MRTHSSLPSSIWLLAGGLAVCLSTYVVSAQGPAPAPATQTPAAEGGRGAVAPPAEAAQGRGGGRGRGPESLAGGPQASDPAYANYDFTKRAPLLPLTPEEQLKKFRLQPGYRMELALADPVIQEPSAIYFDGNGRMFVLEIRGYMMDADATGQLDPVGRVSLHEDVNNDGVYEKHSVFVDNLIFPRFATPFGPNTLLVKESYAQEVWKYTDTNNDGVADKKELWDTGYGRVGNVEHQESHLTWGLDNWLYSTFNAFRARPTASGVIKEPTGNGGAQWGVVQDNDGKMWFQGGASGLPGYWQFPILYGNFGGGRGGGGAPAAPGAITPMDPELSIPWGAPVRIADMQGGLGSTRMPDGSLRGTTAGAGGDIVRGHRMPADLQGEYLYGEVVGRIVRRVHPENKEGITTIRNYYDADEFIKSTDPYFRPVDQTTAPDGTVYITDMYHGIIQEATWSGPGTYLRARIQQYDLDKVIHKGRIWRLVYDGVKADRSDALARDTTMPRMNNETAAQLVTHLGHPNGWWRDTAQQLIVLKQDKSIVPMLQAMLRTSTNLVQKFHVMWSLEGLGALDAGTVRAQMNDREPRMRIQAIRASETLYKAGDKSFAADYKRLSTDPNVDVVIQSMLTMSKWKVADADATIKAVAAANKAAGVQLVATNLLNPAAANAGRGGGGGRGGGTPLSAADAALVEKGGAVYAEVCFACHGADGFGAARPGDTSGGTMAPALAGSPRVNGHRDYVIKAILHGLTGPVGDRSYVEVMIPNVAQTDDWVAAVASYVRTSFGNSSSVVTPADVRRVRAAAGNRRTPWTVAEIEGTLPKLLVPDNSWKLSASHNTAAAPAALILTGWSSQTPQAAGMWYQVELPQPVMLTEIQFSSTAGGGRGGGGGGGRGAAPAAAPGTPAAGAAAPGAPAAAAPAAAAPADPQAAGGRRGGGAGGAGGAAAGGPAPAPNTGYPRGYKVETSMNGTAWTLAAEGQGEGANTVVTFRPVQAKLVKITQTATTAGAPAWSIQQLRLLEVPRPAAR